MTFFLFVLQKKRRKEVKGRDDIQPNTNGLDPYASDDEDKLREMARKFEAKYVRIIFIKSQLKFIIIIFCVIINF